MRKTLIILCTCALLGILAVYEMPTASKTGINQSKTQSASARVPTASQVSTGVKYKNGTFNGTIASNQYEDIQVAVVIQEGKVTTITTPQLTSGSRHSEQINSYAIPLLTQQAISNQSASIDGVSGASYTTQSYTESLQAALDQAKM